MRFAPASIAFSTSSFTAEAGPLNDFSGSDPVDCKFIQLTNNRTFFAYVGVGC